jgi:predicted RNA-binding protein with PUA-like domain
MSRWVFLADPAAYGWDDLVREGRAVWDGVANAIAQRNLRACRPGDDVLVYHTAPDKAIQGTARVVGEPHPDPGAADRVVVDIEPVLRLARPLPLAEIRQDTTLAGMKFVRMPRVAVQPITDAEWQGVLEASGTRWR